jgi:tetratricopeptide (TPR) repeat protein
MEIPDTHLNLIERYLADTLSPTDREAFEMRLENEPNLKEQLSLYEQAREAVDLYAEAQLKAKFRDQYFADKQTERKEKKVKPLFARPLYWVAAAAVVLLAALFIARPWSSSLSPEQLYAANYELPSLNVRGDAETRLDSATLLMGAGGFAEALPILQDLAKDSLFDRRPAAWYRAGLCQMELNNFEEAIDALARVPETTSLVHSSRWYMALSNLRMGQIEESQAQLQLILEKSRDQELKEKAGSLLEELR